MESAHEETKLKAHQTHHKEEEEESEEEFEIVSEPEEVAPIMTEAPEEATSEERFDEATPEQKEATPEEQTPEVPPSEDARKLYVTRFGEKYHLKRNCQGLQSYHSYEKKVGPCCQEATQRVLTFNQSQPTPQSETELSFGTTEYYHHKERRQFYGQRRDRPVCIYCEDEERVLNYARNRIPAQRQSRRD